MKEHSRCLQDILNNKRLCLYGIGQQFKECYQFFCKYNLEILLFDSDKEKQGEKYDGSTILNGESIIEYIDENTVIVISTIKFQFEIAQYLQKLGIKQEKIFSYTNESYEKIYNQLLINENIEVIKNIHEKLADQASKDYYWNSIMMRITRSPLYLQPNEQCVSIGEYEGVLELKKNDVIVDCGAYIGDTVNMYMKRLNCECIIYAMEPFQSSFDSLVRFVNEKNWNNKVKCFNVAVSDFDGKDLLYYNDDTFGMEINIQQVTGKKCQEVNVIQLDTLLGKTKIDYIKMDIEGEEFSALKGAEKIIKKYSPKLMISAYHKIQDFWEIPTLIWSIDREYKIYVGHAKNVSTEMEYYCVKDNM